MGSARSDPDLDDDFSEIYKEYTGPPGSANNNAQDKEKSHKRSLGGPDEEEQLPDPNAVPTDFTSREAKVWEAKSKATERNWKKRKEEEFICKICGESGHFTQGCPSTLGANRKSQDFFERIPARDKHVRALFSEKVMEKIERDTGCKIKMDEKFVIVSGKDRLILRKGVDAVHRVKEEGEHRGSSVSHRSRSRSPRRSPVGPRARNSEPQRPQLGSHGSSSFPERPGRQDKFVENHVRKDQQELSRGSPRAYGSDRAQSRSNHSKSPGKPRYSGWDKPYGRPKPDMNGYRTDRWDHERRGSDIQLSHQLERPSFPQTLEELELEYKREAMELERVRDKDEEEENNKHREAIREMRESYTKKLAVLREMNGKQWEEFLQVDAQRRRQQMSALSYGSYRQLPYAEFEGYSPYGGSNLPTDSKNRYPNHVENYPPMQHHENYGGFQRQRREDYYGKHYNRY
ncbi:PREDICTED: uncharacterized protein LOC104817449 [Tarenaya hassleriana]|uniref:uncharacterized protein LOC104817449 n=1 Tax=Tarenaya hassleriana TaxID=28532 RepID=UPI00053C7F8C|nr:PREDICTED: uncharacterized protein LOC104817449 [Tarenaya hassleriana]XP_010544957.1 PREDICTED: uncharacterized protein LOC104817449 [Tarenaya hassleriana]